MFHSYIRFLLFSRERKEPGGSSFCSRFWMDLYGKGCWVQGPAPLERAGRCSPGRGALRFLLTPLERQEPGLPGRGPISWEEMGKEPWEEVPPRDPLLWWGCVGEAVLLSWYLACGLQDQRLMARPPARAGGRSGSLTGGKSGNPQVYSLPSPKGYPSTSPARPAGGRAVTGLSM